MEIKYPQALAERQNSVARDVGTQVPAGGGLDAVCVTRDVWDTNNHATLIGVEEKPLRGPIGYESADLYKNQFGQMEGIFTKNYVPRLTVDFSLGDDRYLVPYEDFRKIIPKYGNRFNITVDRLIALGAKPLTVEQCNEYFQKQYKYGKYPNCFNTPKSFL
jgi:hypothetical protein